VSSGPYRAMTGSIRWRQRNRCLPQGCHVQHMGCYFLHVHVRSHDTALGGWSTVVKDSPEDPRMMEILRAHPNMLSYPVQRLC
jgi:hypothetical protein